MKPTGTLLAVCCVIVAIHSLVGCTPAPPPASQPAGPVGGGAGKPDIPAAGADDALEKKLATLILPAVDFEGIGFKDVVEFLRDVTGTSIYVNWHTLQLQGIEKTTEVTVHLKKVSVEKAINVILTDVGGTSPLRYLTDEGVMVISTKDDLSKRIITKAYPVGDLVMTTRMPYEIGLGQPWTGTQFLTRVSRKAGGADKRGNSAPKRSGWGGDSNNSSGGGDAATGEEESDTVRVFASEAWATRGLKDLISKTIDPPSWTTDGAMEAMQGSLIVTQTWQNHKDLAKLLADMRRGRGLIGVAVVRVTDAGARLSLEEAAAQGDKIEAVLKKGESDGRWQLDRCGVERPSGAILVTRVNKYAVGGGQVDGADGPPRGEYEALTGYEIGVAVRLSGDANATVVSVACGAAWQDQGSPAVRARHDVFEFELPHGGAKVIQIIPPGANEGCVYAVVWLPKE